MAFSLVEARLGQQMNFVTAEHGFPIQPVGLVQNFFGGFRAAVHLGRGAEQGIDFFNVGILAGFIIGDDDGGMPLFLAERKHEDVPLSHGVLSIRGLWARGSARPWLGDYLPGFRPCYRRWRNSSAGGRGSARFQELPAKQTAAVP